MNTSPAKTITRSDFIITPEAVTTAGLVTYWRLAGTIDLQQLTQVWIATGLDVATLPKPPGAEVALGRAVRDQAHRHRLVRRLKNGSWLVVDETPAADGSTASYDVAASISLVGGRPHITSTSTDWQDNDNASASSRGVLSAAVHNAFHAHQGQLEADDISSWLVKTANKLNAVALRDTGGIYFIPRGNADLWSRIVSAVRAVSSHQVFKIPAMKNTDAIAAITEAISEEVNQAADRVYQEMGGGDLGKRALATRASAAAQLLTKVEEYEALVEARLAARQRVTDLQAAIATAALAAGDE